MISTSYHIKTVSFRTIIDQPFIFNLPFSKVPIFIKYFQYPCKGITPCRKIFSVISSPIFPLYIMLWSVKYTFTCQIKKKLHASYYMYPFYIPISLDTRFQLKLTNLICWTKFIQKDISCQKIEKVNIIIEFQLFELV